MTVELPPAVRDRPAAFQQVRCKHPLHKIEPHDFVFHAQRRGVLSRKWDFAVVVLRPVVEADRRHHRVLAPRPMERRHGIHPARTEHDNFHEGRMATKRHKKTLKEIPRFDRPRIRGLGFLRLFVLL